MSDLAELLCLRLDDVGACSKRYEVYSDWHLGLRKLKIGNLFFLKYVPPFKKWGPYREMTSDEWREILRLLQLYKAKLTVSVTATWAESEKQLIPFPHKFPEEAAALKEGSNNGLLEIANHGLTHCVVAKNVFKPKWVSGNRQFHREFWEWIPADVQEDHIRRSQQILTDYFENEILTFVPPGNVYTEKTLEIAERFGLRYVSCNTPPRRHRRMAIVGDRQVLAFHDKDIVTNGVSWFKDLLERNADKKFRFVRDLGKLMLASQPQDRMA